jgi:hypothetical protein
MLKKVAGVIGEYMHACDAITCDAVLAYGVLES